jgi:hypothetical protein
MHCIPDHIRGLDGLQPDNLSEEKDRIRIFIGYRENERPVCDEAYLGSPFAPGKATFPRSMATPAEQPAETANSETESNMHNSFLMIAKHLLTGYF